MRVENEIVTLVKIRIPSIRPAIELPRECCDAIRIGSSRCPSEAQIKEIPHERVALIIDGVAPCIGRLQRCRSRTIAGSQRHCMIT